MLLVLAAAAAISVVPGITPPVPGTGSVLGHTKISAVGGGFQGPLAAQDQFGRSVDSIGDLDGDGLEELAVGTHGDDEGALNSGAVWILFLDPDRTVRTAQKIGNGAGGFTGVLASGDMFGRAVAGLGDLDGDGIGDIAVGASEAEGGGIDDGVVWILFLNSDGTVKAHQKISATEGGFGGALVDNAQFGRAMDCLGDLDGDGVADLAVGATGDDNGGASLLMGAVWILFLNSDGTVKSEQKIAQGVGGLGHVLADRIFFGYAVANIGDLDGDGIVDLAVGAPFDRSGGAKAGAFWTLLMNTDGTVRAHQKVSALAGGFGGDVEARDQFGGSLAGIGDLDGDGVVDVAAGALEDADGGMRRGAIWILFLHPDGTIAGEQKISDTEGGFTGILDDGDRFPSDLVWLGDVDGDGTGELAVSSRYDDDGAVNAGALWTLSLAGPVTTPPTAAFSAAPVQGITPFDVHFTDSSAGLVSTWDWDFGDGGTSTLREPEHTYVAAGTYSVTLTVGGAAGADSLTRTDLLLVLDPPAPGIADAGFEMQTAGGLPLAPWTVDAGAGHLVHPAGFAADGLFPSEGTQWLEVSAAGTVNATPPSMPGGITMPAVGGAGVSQYFTFPADLPSLEVDACFLLDGDFASAAANDWMSIDVTDGLTTRNVYYQDSFSAFPEVSAAHGLPMTSLVTASVNLASAFPGADSSTLFRLMVQVGNGGDGLRDSRGYVDGLRFVGNDSIVFLGSGVNPPGSFTWISGSSALGDTLVFAIDNPFGTQPVGSLPFVMLSNNPDVNYPAGTLRPGLGMAGPGAMGELLVSRIAPDPFRTIYGAPWLGAGNPAPVSIPMPLVTSWIGRTIYIQGVLYDPAASMGIRYGLAGAVQVLIGP